MTTQFAASLMATPGNYRIAHCGGSSHSMSYAGACTLYELVRRKSDSYSLVGPREVIRSGQDWRRSARERSVHQLGFIPA